MSLLLNKYIAFSILLFSSSSFAFHIVIDPGHGGSDAGAVHNGVRETDITLAVSKYLSEMINENKKFKATLTRSKDNTLGLNDRCRMAENINGDLLVSIHVNSAMDSRASGAQFYFKSLLPPDEEVLLLANRENLNHNYEPTQKSKHKKDLNNILDDLKLEHHLRMSAFLADDMLLNWKRKLSDRKASVRRGPFRVLTDVDMPSILVELGFLTNRREANWLSLKKNQIQIATALFKGIQKFTERMDKYKKSIHSSPHALK